MQISSLSASSMSQASNLSVDNSKPTAKTALESLMNRPSLGDLYDPGGGSAVSKTQAERLADYTTRAAEKLLSLGDAPEGPSYSRGGGNHPGIGGSGPGK